MAKFTRIDAWNEGGDFSNQTLLWYAKGVGKMMSRPMNDQASWWFFAAIHGEYVNPATPGYPGPVFPNWCLISSPPSVPSIALPPPSTQAQYWNQCQHGSWYFLPWHRGYLLALEAQLRADIVSLGGPATWALPYWNYFGGVQGANAKLPPAFAETKLPDGTANPLFVTMRYGPDANGTVYIPTDKWDSTHPKDKNWSYGDVTEKCLSNDKYTGSDPATPLPGFGGPESLFSHNGGPHGNVESNPHDLVHVYTGGSITETNYGLMADPGTAALDPIFYLHHSNIDRVWATWNGTGKANPSDTGWLNGPLRKFVMPMPGGESWSYTPRDMNSLAALDYTYQDLHLPTQPALNATTQRLKNLGVPLSPGVNLRASPVGKVQAPADLLGASAPHVQISGAGTGPVNVRMDHALKNLVTASLSDASHDTPPDRVYLKLENVRGVLDSTVLGVFINLPTDASADERQDYFVGSVGLFGIRAASAVNGAHSGAGLTFVLDISAVVDQLHLQNKLSADNLRVSLLPRQNLPHQTTIEVGRLSLYRQAN